MKVQHLLRFFTSHGYNSSDFHLILFFLDFFLNYYYLWNCHYGSEPHSFFHTLPRLLHISLISSEIQVNDQIVES